MNPLNKEELIVGYVFGCTLIGIIGPWWTILAIAPLCSYLWALGGQGRFGKGPRRLGVPAVLSLCLILSYPFPDMVVAGVISFFAGWLILSLGYGIPTVQPFDEGSEIGRWAFNLATKWAVEAPRVVKERIATWITRTIIFVLFMVVYLIPWAVSR